jgi:hypothetical protein
MAMSDRQVKYALERASQIYRTKLRGCDPTVAPMSHREKLAAIKTGAFTINQKAGSGYWYDSIVFTADAARREAEKKCEAKKFAITKSYERLKDKLVLDDCEDALRMLEAFAADA